MQKGSASRSFPQLVAYLPGKLAPAICGNRAGHGGGVDKGDPVEALQSLNAPSRSRSAARGVGDGLLAGGGCWTQEDDIRICRGREGGRHQILEEAEGTWAELQERRARR
jgi:hypothetical protein